MFARLMRLVLFTAFSLSCAVCCTDIPVEDPDKKLTMEYAKLAESQVTIYCTEAQWWKNLKTTELCTSKDFKHPPANCKSRVRYRFFNYAPSWLDSTSRVLGPAYFKDEEPPALELRVSDFCSPTSKEANIELGCWVYYKEETTWSNDPNPSAVGVDYDPLLYDVGQRIEVKHPSFTMTVQAINFPGSKNNLLGSWELRPGNNLVCKRYGELRKALGIAPTNK